MYKPFAGGGGGVRRAYYTGQRRGLYPKGLMTHSPNWSLHIFLENSWMEFDKESECFFYTWLFWTLITFSVDDVLTLLGENSVPRTVKPVVLYMFSTNVRHVWSTRVVRWLSSWHGSNDPWPFLILLQTVLTLKDHALHWVHLKENKRNTYGNIYFQYVTF